MMIGDTPWDIEAARKAGLPDLAVMTGGFSEAELREAGALAVFETLGDLRAGLPETPLG
ncbi:MAG: HAD hydrolase-like protein [Solirubrobacteraceae bacterium]